MRISIVSLFLTSVFQATVLFAADVEKPAAVRFTKTVLFEGMVDPVAMDICPNGKIYIIERWGTLSVYDPQMKQARVIGKMEPATTSETGLLGLILAPEFSEETPVLYLLYTQEVLNAETGKKQLVHNVSRFRLMDGLLDKSSEEIILKIPFDYGQHVGGDLDFDSHGNLYISVGDNTRNIGTKHNNGIIRNHTKYNYAPLDQRPGKHLYDAQRTAANSMDFRGKILRIRPVANGARPYTIPEGNLFPDGKGGLPEIYTMGNRNPFRIQVDRKADVLYWGEVGVNASDKSERGPPGYDEINRAEKAGNFGWPYFSGNNESSALMDYDTAEVIRYFDPETPENLSPNNSGLKILPKPQPAFLAYSGRSHPLYPELGQGGKTAIPGPVYYYRESSKQSASAFPAYYDRVLFISDWVRSWINLVHLDAENKIKSIERFMPGEAFAKAVKMKFGPDGALYILEYGSSYRNSLNSKLSKVGYNAGNLPPLAHMTADKTVGDLPLSVNFSADQSLDHDADDILTFRWFLNDSTLIGESKKINYSFKSAGVFPVKLVVNDGQGGSDSTELNIYVGNYPPEVTINLLSGNRSFYWDRVDYEIIVTDKEDERTSQGISSTEVEYEVQRIPVSPGKLSVEHRDRVDELLLDGLEMLKRNNCLACHQPAPEAVIPTYFKIADHYKGDYRFLNELADKVLRGGSGTFGEIPMAPHPQLNRHDLVEMVRYILSLHQRPAVMNAPGLKGSLSSSGFDRDLISIQASYTDRGFESTAVLSDTSRVLLRSPRFEAGMFNSLSNVSLRQTESGQNVLNGVFDNGFALMKGIDLSGIGSITMRLRPIVPGFQIELQVGSEDGPSVAVYREEGTVSRDWKEVTVDLKQTSGFHDLYLSFYSERELRRNFVEIEWLEFNLKNNPF
jgi:cytochrome c